MAASLARVTWLLSTLILALMLLQLFEFATEPECMCFWDDTVRRVRGQQWDATSMTAIGLMAGEVIWLTSAGRIGVRTVWALVRWLPLGALMYVIALSDHAILHPLPSH